MSELRDGVNRQTQEEVTPENAINFIMVGGAAGALFYVLRLLVEGRLHTHSEVEGLRQDKADLFQANTALVGTVRETQVTLGEVLRILKEQDDA